MSETKADVMQTLAGMITEVIGDDIFEIVETSSFRDDLAFQSIQFVALAELIQERWTELDFVTWLTGKAMPEVLALRVGDVADFVVSTS